MECHPVAKLPEAAIWTREIKLDGWRMEIVKTEGRVTLYSRRAKILTAKDTPSQPTGSPTSSDAGNSGEPA
jgi:ATP-dependent DNA ligase